MDYTYRNIMINNRNYDTAYTFLISDRDNPMHTHVDFYEISLITSGTFKHIYNGKTEILKKNVLIMFNLGESHEIMMMEPNSFHFTLVVQPKQFEEFKKSHFPQVENLFNENYIMRQLNDTYGDFLYTLSSQMLDTRFSSDQGNLINLFLFTAFSFAIGDLCKNTATTTTEKCIENLIAQINGMHYIDYPINKIYKDYPISQSTLISMFKKRTGYTIVQYCGNKKMEYAARMLSTTQYNVTEIANFLNISSLSHFIKKFKKQFGISPKEYQKKFNNSYNEET